MNSVSKWLKKIMRWLEWGMASEDSYLKTVSTNDMMKATLQKFRAEYSKGVPTPMGKLQWVY